MAEAGKNPPIIPERIEFDGFSKAVHEVLLSAEGEEFKKMLAYLVGLLFHTQSERYASVLNMVKEVQKIIAENGELYQGLNHTLDQEVMGRLANIHGFLSALYRFSQEAQPGLDHHSRLRSAAIMFGVEQGVTYNS